jgi:PAS domain S-box-containing protein
VRTTFETSLLPPEAKVDRQSLRYYLDKSTLAIPFDWEPGVRGAITFSATTRHQPWLAGLLGHCRLVAQVIGSALAHARSSRALAASERQFRALANSIPQLAWIAEADGSIHWYNQRWYEYTGTTPEEMEAEGGWGWKRVHEPDDVPRVLKRFQESIASGEPWEDQFSLRRKDGELRWHLSRAMPLRDSAGRVIRWFGTDTDVEDQRRQEARLREAIEARDTFLSIAGHELRTPLTPLTLKVQMLGRTLQSGSASPAELLQSARSEVESIGRQVGRLSALVDDLMDVSRLTRERAGLTLEPVDLTELVGDVLGRAQGLAQHCARSRNRGG